MVVEINRLENVLVSCKTIIILSLQSSRWKNLETRPLLQQPGIFDQLDDFLLPVCLLPHQVKIRSNLVSALVTIHPPQVLDQAFLEK